MRRALNGNVNISSRHGQYTTMGMYGRHLGYDYAGNGMTVVAPENMTVTGLYSGGSGGYYIEARGRYTHRFLHLRRHSLLRAFGVSVGQLIPEGTAFAVSNNTGATTGPHLHHDARKNGTAWNSSFSNFVDWEALLIVAPTPPSKMPKVDQTINITKGVTRSVYRAGTATVIGKIYAKDTTYNYTVRGFDSKYPYRILINSASLGNGVALALYDVAGNRIDGWTLK